MNPEIKKMWVEALRSGEYEQGFGQLRITYPDKVVHCCLGVLCDIARKMNIVDADFLGFTTILPDPVSIWADVESNPACDTVTTSNRQERRTLAGLNDSRTFDFKAIADIIEAQL